MRATSSVKSAGVRRSERHAGGSTSKLVSLTSHPMVRRTSAILAGATSTPSVRDICAGSIFTIGEKRGSPSTTVATWTAELFSVSNCTKRAEAY